MGAGAGRWERELGDESGSWPLRNKIDNTNLIAPNCAKYSGLKITYSWPLHHNKYGRLTCPVIEILTDNTNDR